VNAPTLLLHGELDDRVPLSQSRLVYQVLSARGVVTDLRLFPGEGHLFHAPWAVQEAWARSVAWLQHHTADGAA
jgi:dipeptidyl aminopeptidase/acylaminoacyl peptidase